MNFGDRHCGVTYCFVINPRRACVMGTVVVCMCVCGVSVFSILPSRAFRCPTRSISGHSVENAVK